MNEALPTITAARTALLVMDYQPGILSAVPDPQGLLSRAAYAIRIVRSHRGQIGYVRVAFDDADIAAMPSSNKMAARIASSGKAFHSDSPTTAIHDSVAPQPGDIVVRKTRVGPFLTTDLDKQLRERGIDTLILAGLSTSGVLLSTVRDAADRDYALYVLADASADPESDVHKFLIEKIFPRQADVITIADLPALFA